MHLREYFRGSVAALAAIPILILGTAAASQFQSQSQSQSITNSTTGFTMTQSQSQTQSQGSNNIVNHVNEGANAAAGEPQTSTTTTPSTSTMAPTMTTNPEETSTNDTTADNTNDNLGNTTDNNTDNTTNDMTNNASNDNTSNTDNTDQTNANLTNSNTGRAYIAVGDSVPAGLGLGGSENQTCGRSTDGYPNLVSSDLNLRLINETCSGATVNDVMQQLNDGFNRSSRPALITVTAGANDAHWIDLLKSCFVSNCDTNTNRAQATADLATLRANLNSMFKEIKSHERNNSTEVVVTGYYNPFASCTNASQNITPSELSFLNNQLSRLNRSISDVTSKYSFANFTSIDFSGHDICSSSPWVQSFSDPAPLHPTVDGQQQIADAVTQSAASVSN